MADFKPARLSGPRTGHQAQLIGDTLYVFGGTGNDGVGQNSMASTWMLNPLNQKWVKRASMNQPKTHFASVVVNETIYAIGGHGGAGDKGYIERYDAKANRWSLVHESKDLPKTHHSAVASGELIYIIGGFPSDNVHLHVFNTQTKKLASLPKLPGFQRGDHFHHLTVLDGKLHVLGAMRFNPESGVLREHWRLNGNKWEKRAALPKPSMSKFSCYGVIDNKLYLFSKLDDLHHIYDPKTDKWADKPKPLPASIGITATVTDGKRLHVISGARYKSDEKDQPTILTYDAESNTWHETK